MVRMDEVGAVAANVGPRLGCLMLCDRPKEVDAIIEMRNGRADGMTEYPKSVAV